MHDDKLVEENSFVWIDLLPKLLSLCSKNLAGDARQKAIELLELAQQQTKKGS